MPPKKKTTADDTEITGAEPTQIEPAEAAAGEAAGEPITFTFRDVEFTVPRSIGGNARYRMGFAAGRLDEVLLATLAESDDHGAYLKFMSLLRPGDEMNTVAREYLDALSTAAGWGNS